MPSDCPAIRPCGLRVDFNIKILIQVNLPCTQGLEALNIFLCLSGLVNVALPSSDLRTL